MSEQEYSTLRSKPLNQLLQLPARDVALFLQSCPPRTREALSRARWNR